MEYLNKVELIGVIGNVSTNDINGTKITRLVVCTNETYKTESGEFTLSTTWFNVTIFNPSEEFARGEWIHVIGRFRIQKYLDQNNVERQIYEILANSVEILKVQ